MIVKVEDLNIIISELKAGRIVAIPTDTVYGLASIIQDEAIEKLFELKKREQKPIAVLAANTDQFDQVTSEVSEEALILAKHFLPGALTLVMPKKVGVSDILTQGYPTIGVRIPDDETTLKILEKVGPLAVSSANISGEEPINNYQDLAAKFPEICVLEGEVKTFKPSTVVSVVEGVKVLREGPISFEEISEILDRNKGLKKD